MKRTGDARSDILRSIRESLAASAPYDALQTAQHSSGALPVLPTVVGAPELQAASPASLAAAPQPVAPVPIAGAGMSHTQGLLVRFTERVRAVGGQVTVLTHQGDAAAALSRILHAAGAQRIVASDDALIRDLLSATNEFVIRNVEDLSQDELFACDTGVTAAQWGIAETGTLVLESSHERNRLASLVPRVHVAVLDAGRICETLGDALARVSAVDNGHDMINRAITFITGPSRTSDIELTLVIGVHGPQVLHVIVFDTRQPEVLAS